VFISIFLALEIKSEETDPDFARQYFYFPKASDTWDISYLLGFTLTKLPAYIVEEEINTSPALFGALRMELPLNFSTNLLISSNYISNIGTLGLMYHLNLGLTNLSVGMNGSMWFGHLDIEYIKLKAYGILVKPIATVGFDFNDFLLSSSLELQYGYMKTFSDDDSYLEWEDEFISKSWYPASCLSLRINVEQPLWNNNWVLLGVGLHWATFYYQAWITYSAIKQPLIYPEFYFSFIL